MRFFFAYLLNRKGYVPNSHDTISGTLKIDILIQILRNTKNNGPLRCCDNCARYLVGRDEFPHVHEYLLHVKNKEILFECKLHKKNVLFNFIFSQITLS